MSKILANIEDVASITLDGIVHTDFESPEFKEAMKKESLKAVKYFAKNYKDCPDCKVEDESIFRICANHAPKQLGVENATHTEPV